MEAAVTSRNWRVLVADDDPAICTLVETILKKGSYDVFSCNDAEAALVALEQQPPFDIIVCDFMLPGISGLDFIERVRADAHVHEIPILMISGHTNYAMSDRAKNAGANMFLDKPFTVSQLRSSVESLIAQSAEGVLTIVTNER